MMDPKPGLSKILTLTCEESTFLASESLDRKLTIPERLATGTHEILCVGCKRFRKQLILIRDAVREMNGDESAHTGLELPPESREKIREAMAHEAG